MKNIIVKVMLIFTIILTIFNNYYVQAIVDPSTNPSYYNPGNVDDGEEEFLKMAGTMLGVINTIGVVVSVIILMIVGIKYMLGSVEEKAEYKKTMINYVVGAILLFASTTIANILYTIGKTF